MSEENPEWERVPSKQTSLPFPFLGQINAFGLQPSLHHFLGSSMPFLHSFRNFVLLPN